MGGRERGGEDVALQITDVAERQRRAEQLEHSLEFSRRVLQLLPEYVVLLDRQYRVVWINRVRADLTLGQVIGCKLEAFIASGGFPTAQRAIDRAFDAATIEHYEVEGFAQAGGTAWYSVRVVPLLSGAGVDNVLLFTADVTERRRAEAALRENQSQLHRSQRLESVGQLAGGIAHDFNNLLQVIEGNLSFIKEALQTGQNPQQDLDQALRATQRAGELTAHLLAIGRKSRVMTQRVVLGTLVEECVRILRRAIPESVSLSYHAHAEPCVVDLDPPQFEQVLLNLCVHARDAMPGGGAIAIAIMPDGEQHVVMKVSDTGGGTSAEHLNRMFEPFFSKGSGSGLGLAVAAGIVEAHGGELTAESDGASGTTMKVRLPRLASAAPEPAPPGPSPALDGSGLILVAEDESLVRTQVDRILRRAGYSVLQAENGARAVELFEQHHAEVVLVLMDVVMPVLDGWKAYLKMQAIVPNVKVLFTTGYAANVLPADYGARGARLVAKPYRREQLLLAIGELLELRSPQ